LKLWVFLLILVELLLVAWFDIRTKKISNRWVLGNLLFAPVLYVLLPETYPWDWTVLIFPVGCILVGFFLFLLGIMGAGDSKYLASLFLITPPDLHMFLFTQLINSTAIVGFVFLSLKIAKDFQKIRAYALSAYWQGLKETIRSHFSYAPVILMAWLLVGYKIWK
jgi:prepilin peptidase CpaA